MVAINLSDTFPMFRHIYCTPTGWSNWFIHLIFVPHAKQVTLPVFRFSTASLKCAHKTFIEQQSRLRHRCYGRDEEKSNLIHNLKSMAVAMCAMCAGADTEATIDVCIIYSASSCHENIPKQSHCRLSHIIHSYVNVTPEYILQSNLECCLNVDQNHWFRFTWKMCALLPTGWWTTSKPHFHPNVRANFRTQLNSEHRSTQISHFPLPATHTNRTNLFVNF